MATMLLPAFRFEVRLVLAADVVAGRQRPPGGSSGYRAPTGQAMLGSGGFQEVTGLDIEMDVQEYLEGGRNNGTVRRVGRARYAPLVLRRGMFHTKDDGADPGLWHWLQRIVNGERPVPRCDGAVTLMAADGSPRATWVFDRALPAKLRGPALHAATGGVAIEELTLAHEGLRLLPAEAPL
jgi:phage tail-like protein